MSALDGLKLFRRQRQPQLPPEVYVSVVDSLYYDYATLFVGFSAQFLAAMATAWKTGDQVLGMLALAIGLASTLRVIEILYYVRRHRSTLDFKTAARWEKRY